MVILVFLVWEFAKGSKVYVYLRLGCLYGIIFELFCFLGKKCGWFFVKYYNLVLLNIERFWYKFIKFREFFLGNIDLCMLFLVSNFFNYLKFYI